MNVLVDQELDARNVVYESAAGPGFSAITIQGTTFQRGAATVTVQANRNKKWVACGVV